MCASVPALSVAYTTANRYSDLSALVEIIGGSFSILWPPHKIGVLYPEDRNRDSLILRFEVGAFSLLCAGDAKGNVWPHVDQAKLKAHVLRYPHHGGKLSASKDDWSAEDLVSKVDPAWVVVSVGVDNLYSHPSQEFHDCASRHTGRQFLFTTKGDISLQIDSESGDIQQESTI